MDSRGSPRDVRDGRAGSVTARRLCDGHAEMEMASSFRVEISSSFIGPKENFDCFVTAYM
jgi:hypothetical protein